MPHQILSVLDSAVRRLEPDLNLDCIELELTVDGSGTHHLNWCLDHTAEKTAIVTLAQLPYLQLCSGIQEYDLTAFTGAFTDKELASAIDIASEIDRQDFRPVEEIRSEVNDLTGVVHLAFELVQFRDTTWDMIAPALSAIPKKYEEVLQPDVDRLVRRINDMDRLTIGHPVVRDRIDQHFISQLGTLDMTPVEVALGPLWYIYSSRFQTEAPDSQSSRLVFAAISSYVPEIVNTRAFVTLPSWLYLQVKEHAPQLLLSSPYSNLSAEVKETALKLWTEEEGEAFASFDTCVSAAKKLFA